MGENAQAILLFTAVSAFCIVYSAYQYASFIINKEKISYAMATIIDTITTAPETMKINNSRWALVSFRVDGKEYVSSDRIQISMSYSVGDQIRIAYYKDNPREIFTPTLKKAGIFFVIGILCIAILFYFKFN